ncbi:copper amine oxidase N-terminal domain-containing protein [Phosphitispora sp. TUW77]|uniref:copper amine oxidase N-terminal domain-containing protein n=1 Tax=Phosphitispora sp. TUW77 TaxID=3152361 RepID=UPI003AB4F6E6
MLKKKLFVTMFLILAIGLLAAPVSATVDYYDFYKVVKLTVGENLSYINDSPYYSDQAPFIDSGRTLVPLRFVAEALDAYVDWMPSTRTVLIETDSGTIIKVAIGNKTAYIDNNPVILDVPAVIKGGRTFVPLRFVGEAMGAGVEWEPASRTIRVINVDISDWEEYIEPITGSSVLFPGVDWESVCEGSSLIIESPEETEFELTYDNRDMATIMKLKKDLLTSEGWNLESETNTSFRMTKENIYINSNRYIYIFSVQKAGAGNIVYSVETNLEALDQDLAVVNKIISTLVIKS